VIGLIGLLSTLVFGAMLAGAVLFAFGFFAGARWEAGRDTAPAPRLVIPTASAAPRYTPPPREDFDQFCVRTDWCAGHLGHSGECFTSSLGERPR
jgi:hypothetical protein